MPDAPVLPGRRRGSPDPASPPRLLDRLRAAVRARHYSLRTEDAYAAWVRRYVLFHGKRHPAEMGEAEINAFLSSLATDGRVAASTQNQALSALLFLYRHGLDQARPRVAPRPRPRPPAVAGDGRTLRAVVLSFGSIVAMPVYWFPRVRREPGPAVAPPLPVPPMPGAV